MPTKFKPAPPAPTKPTPVVKPPVDESEIEKPKETTSQAAKEQQENESKGIAVEPIAEDNLRPAVRPSQTGSIPSGIRWRMQAGLDYNTAKAAHEAQEVQDEITAKEKAKRK